MIKFQQCQTSTSHFESFWSIVGCGDICFNGNSHVANVINGNNSSLHHGSPIMASVLTSKISSDFRYDYF